MQLSIRMKLYYFNVIRTLQKELILTTSVLAKFRKTHGTVEKTELTNLLFNLFVHTNPSLNKKYEIMFPFNSICMRLRLIYLNIYLLFKAYVKLNISGIQLNRIDLITNLF